MVGHSARVVFGAIAVLAGGRKAKFTGLYLGETGYASCLNSSQDTCETNTTGDGLDCEDVHRQGPRTVPCSARLENGVESRVALARA